MGFTIGITHHAVDQYIKRHAREMPFNEARALLEASVPTAVKLKEKTCNGQEQWRIEELGIVLVTKRDYGEYVCVTVLPCFEPQGMSQEELEYLEEYQARVHMQEEALRKQLPDVRAAAEVVEKMPKEAFPKGEKAARVNESKTRLAELNRQIEILHMEAAIIGQQTKTIRHTLTMSDTDRKMKVALRAAMKFLMDHAVHHPEAAAETMAKVRVVEPGYLTPEFYDLKKAS